MALMKTLFAIIIFITPYCLHAEIYKWVDAQGMVHYGDKPQSDNVEKIQIKKSPVKENSDDTDKGSRKEMRQRVSDLLETDRLAKKEARKERKEEREHKRSECNSLKDKQKRFKNAGSIYNLNKNGERTTLSAEQRKKSEQRLQQRINKACR